MANPRHDYGFPFRIDSASRQAQRTSYERHVTQMVIQVLLTSPGERADLPEFGCGLRAMLFAPSSPALTATTQLLVQHALDRWLSDHLAVTRVEVTSPDGRTEQIDVRVEYTLLATRATHSVDVRVT
jgi:phage baseplate assembly protein W